MRLIQRDLMYEGAIFDVYTESWQHDGADSHVVRDVVEHHDAVAIVAYDDRHVYLLRQPREAVMEPALLEIPAGLLDIEGEGEQRAAERELQEELGITAGRWQRVRTVYPSAGSGRERLTIFFATELTHGEPSPTPDERIDPCPWPLDDLEGALSQAMDSKTVIGLLELQRRISCASADAV